VVVQGLTLESDAGGAEDLAVGTECGCGGLGGHCGIASGFEGEEKVIASIEGGWFLLYGVLQCLCLVRKTGGGQ
jgi:hypothetical protein